MSGNESDLEDIESRLYSQFYHSSVPEEIPEPLDTSLGGTTKSYYKPRYYNRVTKDANKTVSSEPKSNQHQSNNTQNVPTDHQPNIPNLPTDPTPNLPNDQPPNPIPSNSSTTHTQNFSLNFNSAHQSENNQPSSSTQQRNVKKPHPNLLINTNDPRYAYKPMKGYDGLPPLAYPDLTKAQRKKFIRQADKDKAARIVKAANENAELLLKLTPQERFTVSKYLKKQRYNERRRERKKAEKEQKLIENYNKAQQKLQSKLKDSIPPPENITNQQKSDTIICLSDDNDDPESCMLIEQKIEVLTVSDDEDVKPVIATTKLEVAAVSNVEDDDIVIVETTPIIVEPINLDPDPPLKPLTDAELMKPPADFDTASLSSSTSATRLSDESKVKSSPKKASPANSLATSESSNDFLDTTVQLNHDDFNFSLHGNDFTAAKAVAVVYESESSCSASDISTPLKNVVFNEIDFDSPTKGMFAENNLDSFGAFITPKRGPSIPSILTPSAEPFESDVATRELGGDCKTASDSSSESEYEDVRKSGKQLPSLTPFDDDDGVKEKVKRKKDRKSVDDEDEKGKGRKDGDSDKKKRKKGRLEEEAESPMKRLKKSLDGDEVEGDEFVEVSPTKKLKKKKKSSEGEMEESNISPTKKINKKKGGNKSDEWQEEPIEIVNNELSAKKKKKLNESVETPTMKAKKRNEGDESASKSKKKKSYSDVDEDENIIQTPKSKKKRTTSGDEGDKVIPTKANKKTGSDVDEIEDVTSKSKKKKGGEDDIIPTPKSKKKKATTDDDDDFLPTSNSKSDTEETKMKKKKTITDNEEITVATPKSKKKKSSTDLIEDDVASKSKKNISSDVAEVTEEDEHILIINIEDENNAQATNKSKKKKPCTDDESTPKPKKKKSHSDADEITSETPTTAIKAKKDGVDDMVVVGSPKRITKMVIDENRTSTDSEKTVIIGDFKNNSDSERDSDVELLDEPPVVIDLDSDSSVYDSTELEKVDADLQMNLNASQPEVTQQVQAGARMRFRDYWTQDMDKFYNSMWGNENLTLEDIHKTQSDDPAMWKILERDRVHIRLHGGGGPRCNRCRQVGHIGSQCTNKQGPPKCSLCGGRGHMEPRCPDKLCTQCGRKGYYSTTSCRYCAHYKHKRCDTCKCYGHPTNSCPDLWRRYHLTTNNGPLERLKTTLKATRYRWCSGCGAQGHFEYKCKKSYNRSHFPTRPEIISYDDVYGSTEQNEPRTSGQPLPPVPRTSGQPLPPVPVLETTSPSLKSMTPSSSKPTTLAPYISLDFTDDSVVTNFCTDIDYRKTNVNIPPNVANLAPPLMSLATQKMLFPKKGVISNPPPLMNSSSPLFSEPRMDPHTRSIPPQKRAVAANFFTERPSFGGTIATAIPSLMELPLLAKPTTSTQPMPAVVSLNSNYTTRENGDVIKRQSLDETNIPQLMELPFFAEPSTSSRPIPPTVNKKDIISYDTTEALKQIVKEPNCDVYELNRIQYLNLATTKGQIFMKNMEINCLVRCDITMGNDVETYNLKICGNRQDLDVVSLRLDMYLYGMFSEKVIAHMINSIATRVKKTESLKQNTWDFYTNGQLHKQVKYSKLNMFLFAQKFLKGGEAHFKFLKKAHADLSLGKRLTKTFKVAINKSIHYLYNRKRNNAEYEEMLQYLENEERGLLETITKSICVAGYKANRLMKSEDGARLLQSFDPEVSVEISFFDDDSRADVRITSRRDLCDDANLRIQNFLNGLAEVSSFPAKTVDIGRLLVVKLARVNVDFFVTDCPSLYRDILRLEEEPERRGELPEKIERLHSIFFAKYMYLEGSRHLAALIRWRDKLRNSGDGDLLSKASLKEIRQAHDYIFGDERKVDVDYEMLVSKTMALESAVVGDPIDRQEIDRLVGVYEERCIQDRLPDKLEELVYFKKFLSQDYREDMWPQAQRFLHNVKRYITASGHEVP